MFVSRGVQVGLGLRSMVRRAGLHSSGVLRMAEEGASPASMVKLNFNVPHERIYDGEQVYSVIIPGMVGEYGVTGSHMPVVSELKPGLVQVFKSEGDEPEKYFVSGGFALTHEDSTTDITAVEAFKLEDLDPALATKGYLEYKSKVDAAAPESQEHAIAQINLEVYEALCNALGAPTN